MMSEVSVYTALSLAKVRLNRMSSELDEYLEARIRAAIGALEQTGISLTDSVDDIMLVADYAVWQYQNRDKPGDMPEWLRLMRRERWLNNRGEVKANDT